jgi:putative cardiolipin synthase
VKKSLSVLNYLLLMASALSISLTAGAQDVPGDKSPWAGLYISGALLKTEDPQELQILNSGAAALAARVQLIRSAQKSIDLESFIFKMDRSGQIIVQELIRAAQKGVKVRLLVDSTPFWLDVDNSLIRSLNQNGIEVRFYNNTFIFNLIAANHRTHRKLLIVDNEVAITGGRNIADEYFDLDPKFNFLDRDIIVRGSVVREFTLSFDHFWKTRLTDAKSALREPILAEYGFSSEREAQQQSRVSESSRQRWLRYRQDRRMFEKKMQKQDQFLATSSEIDQILARAFKVQRLEDQKNPPLKCKETLYVSDLPGFKSQSRVVYQNLRTLVDSAEKSLVVESPYVVMTNKDNLFYRSVRRGLKVNILTNSLYSTDNKLVAAVFYSRIGDLVKAGAQTNIFTGVAPHYYEVTNESVRQTRWGIHSKTVVLDGKDTMISSFNMDPRSKHINAEVALICRNNPILANQVLRDIHLRSADSVQLNEKGRPVDGRDKYFHTSNGKIFLYHALSPLAHLFDFLL